MKTIPGLPGYCATEEGKIIGPSGKVLTQRKHKGYYQVAVGPVDYRTTKMVNRLIALAFLGEPPDSSYHAAHKNGDSFDNRVENLYWATPKENCAERNTARGERNGSAVLTAREVADIRHLYKKGFSQADLADEFDVSQGAVSNILTNKAWIG